MVIARQRIKSAILLKNDDDEWPKEKRPRGAAVTTSKEVNVALSMQTDKKAPLAGLQPDRRSGE